MTAKMLYRVKIANESGHLSYAITDTPPVDGGTHMFLDSLTYVDHSWRFEYFAGIEDGDTFGSSSVAAKWVTWRRVKPGEVTIPPRTTRKRLTVYVNDPDSE